MNLHKLTAGSGYTYLTRQVAANDVTDRGLGDLGSYYSERGEAPGMWLGRGLASVPRFEDPGLVTEAQMRSLFGEGRHPNATSIARDLRSAGRSEAEVDRETRIGAPFRGYTRPTEFGRRCVAAFQEYRRNRGLPVASTLPPEVRSGIRTDVARAMFSDRHGRPPCDSRELSGHLARISRLSAATVAGYDLTFSPVKSVSVLWALAPREVAVQIERAHGQAVEDTIAWLERHASYTRRGHGGVAQVDVRGLIAAAFVHRDSRSGDPDLHTHVAISNKVQALDGAWLALDGHPLHECAVAASERYNTRLEALLTASLGLVFAERPGAAPGKRGVREIVGMDGELPRHWSSRRADIEARQCELVSRFQAEHGRVPTITESVALAQQATLETRPGKHGPRSYAEQRTAWRAEALAVLGSAERLEAYVGRALNRPARPPIEVTPEWVAATARTVVTTVAASRATWQERHLRAEAERQARVAGVPHAELDCAVDAVVASAVDQSICLSGRQPCDEPSVKHSVEPSVLRRRDGTSVFVTAGSARYTSTEILDAERAVLASAERYDGRVASGLLVVRQLERADVDGQSLTDGQRGLVRQLATSGARVQLALAPAGTGKTTALRALADVWKASGGTVLGLAPSAAAAALLRDEIDCPTDTLAKCTHALASSGPLPRWLAECGPGTLLIVDEAGMASTPDLAGAVTFVTARGGSVRLIGDDGQLAAVGAGGLLKDLAERYGAATLTEPLRFRHSDTGTLNRAEGAASLALRAGDAAALGFYLDHGRVHVAAPDTAADDAYAAWSADRAAGRDALLLAPARDLVTALNARARHDRLAAQPRSPGRTALLADGLAASPGDSVLTRRNDRRLRPASRGRSETGHYVRNGDRWTVRTVTAAGDLVVTHCRSGARIRLPHDYVSHHVVLGYATTIHTAQGLTADTCHTVVTGAEGRRALYVALTRGRHANHVYVQLGGDGDPHTLIRRDALVPPTAGDVLARMLARDDTAPSATTQLRHLSAPGPLLSASARQYTHALHAAAEDLAGPAGVAGLDRLGEHTLAGLTDCPAWPSLRFNLAVAALEGRDPAVLLRTAAGTRRLDDARDAAAVLDWRLGMQDPAAGPLPWLAAVPGVLADDPVWGPYLLHRREAVDASTSAVRAEAGSTASPPMPWMTALGGGDHDPQLLTDLAVWRAAHDVEAADQRPTGPAQSAAADARAQAELDRRVGRAIGRSDLGAWTAVAAAIDARLATDPYWPVVADRLQRLDVVADAAALVLRSGRERPLPDEHAAAALWWRLCGHLSSTGRVLTGASTSPGSSAAAAGVDTGRPARRSPTPGQSLAERPHGQPVRLPSPRGSLRDRAAQLRPLLTAVTTAHRRSRRQPPAPPR